MKFANVYVDIFILSRSLFKINKAFILYSLCMREYREFSWLLASLLIKENKEHMEKKGIYTKNLSFLLQIYNLCKIKRIALSILCRPNAITDKKHFYAIAGILLF